MREHFITHTKSLWPQTLERLLLRSQVLLNLICYPAVDSESSLSPLVDETQPFTVPFRPYAWSSYPGPALRPLVQQNLYPCSEVDRDPSAMALYRDKSTHPALFSDREEAYGDYRRHALLFPETGLSGNPHEVKAQSELLCSSLILSGAYKCIKCSKVRMLPARAQLCSI